MAAATTCGIGTFGATHDAGAGGIGAAPDLSGRRPRSAAGSSVSGRPPAALRRRRGDSGHDGLCSAAGALVAWAKRVTANASPRGRRSVESGRDYWSPASRKGEGMCGNQQVHGADRLAGCSSRAGCGRNARGRSRRRNRTLRRASSFRTATISVSSLPLLQAPNSSSDTVTADRATTSPFACASRQAPPGRAPCHGGWRAGPAPLRPRSMKTTMSVSRM